MQSEAKKNRKFSVLHTGVEYRTDKAKVLRVKEAHELIVPSLDAVGTVESLASFEGYVFCPTENTASAVDALAFLYGCDKRDIDVLGIVSYEEISNMLEAASLRIDRDIDFGQAHKIIEGEYKGLFVTPLLIREHTGNVVCSYQVTGVDRLVDVPPQSLVKEQDPYEEISDNFLIDIRSEALKQGVRRVLVIDATYLTMRSIFTYDRMYKTSDGTFVGGRLGFYYSLLKMKQLYPEYEVHVVFDAMKKRSFFTKVGRGKNRLGKAVEQTWDWNIALAKACGMHVYYIKNKEARDVIASVTSTLLRQHLMDRVYIVSKDDDFASLVCHEVSMYLPKITQRDQDRIVHLRDIQERFGVQETHKIIWLKCFLGDVGSDIPSISQVLGKPVKNQEVLDMVNKVNSLEDLRDRVIAGEFGSSLMTFVKRGTFDKHLKRMSLDLSIFDDNQGLLDLYANRFDEDRIQYLLEESDFYSELEYLSKSLVVLKGLWIK